MKPTESSPAKVPGKQEVWEELCSSLNLTSELASIEPPSEDEDEGCLTTKALLLWDEYDKCEEAIAPVLYVLCKKLNAQGKKGEGFRKWLDDHKKPHATAYRWIKKYADQNGLPYPYENTKKAKSTSSHVGQGSKVVPFTAPAPRTLAAAKLTLQRMFEGVDADTCSEWAKELVEWITSQYLVPSIATPGERK